MAISQPLNNLPFGKVVRAFVVVVGGYLCQRVLAFVIAEEYEVYQAMMNSLINLHSSEREKEGGA